MNWYLKVISQYAEFNGRARRKEFWMFTLFNLLVVYGLQLVAHAVEVPAMLFAATIYTFTILIPSIAVGVRRMHDVGKSGWYILIPIYSIILALTDGEMGSNAHGADPSATPDAILYKV